ncbi:hypothetical protein C7B61_10855 [filamentous cyanobacterium CCP1]|nr:hypothetical protein C7B76_17485 [filamentous cyanobacterium CCP2]PSB65868.1 hypothetical protein C7B61_10855 [filamentous cyanobacterium CCP1]
MNPPPHPRPLGEAERVLFQLYINCQLSLVHPRRLYQEYDLTYDQLALIAGCSLPTMERWMSQNREPRSYKAIYLRRLGEFYFLIRYYHQIPREVFESICPLPEPVRSILYPVCEENAQVEE